MDRTAGSSLRLARTLAQSFVSPLSSRSATQVFPSAGRAAAMVRRPCTAPASSLSATSRPIRLFSITAATRNADEPPKEGASPVQSAPAIVDSPPARKPASSGSLMEGLADLLPSTREPSGMAASAGQGRAAAGSSLTGLEDFDRMRREVDHSMEEYHFAVYSHKHNTHITVSKPNRDVIISMSCGQIGFRKGQRKSYDAAYQLGAYVCDKLYQNNWHKKIQKMRVTLRGFGNGRDAVTKILLGTEGRLLRNKITQVADTTRLKFGGTRSPAPRRLG